MILDWSNGALKTKHLKDQSTRAAPVRKLSQVRHSIAKNAVCKKYKEQLGFGDKTVFLCRGSPLAPEVLKYLAGFDILGQVHHMYSRILKPRNFVIMGHISVQPRFFRVNLDCIIFSTSSNY